VLTALQVPGTGAAVDRLATLATPDGWPQTAVGPPRYLPDARIHDVTLGTAGVLLAALWARRLGVADARALAEHAAGVLMAEAEQEPSGTNWRMVPPRFHTDPAGIQMPNLSHGLAGVAAALALAGAELDRPDLTAAAHSGAEHLVTLGDRSGQGFVVPRTAGLTDDEVTYTWCHGATGTSLLFLALRRAGVEDVAGEAPLSWHARCLLSVRTSGLPARLHPGFWDNDGRCCGTAGVGDAFLDSWQRAGDDQDLEFALHLADTLVEHAVREGPHAYWRFVEHRAAERCCGRVWDGCRGPPASRRPVSREPHPGRRDRRRARRADGHLVGHSPRQTDTSRGMHTSGCVRKPSDLGVRVAARGRTPGKPRGPSR